MTPEDKRRKEAAIDKVFQSGLAPTEAPPPPETPEESHQPTRGGRRVGDDHARELQLEFEEQERKGQFMP